MGKLRECMKRDMEIRGFSPSTQQAYLHQVKALARHFGRTPDALTLEDIHTYQLHLTRERKIASSSLTQAVAALRFFYGVTCKKDWDIEQIPYPKRKRRLPVVFNQTELLRLFDAVENLKHRTICYPTQSSPDPCTARRCRTAVGVVPTWSLRTFSVSGRIGYRDSTVNKRVWCETSCVAGPPTSAVTSTSVSGVGFGRSPTIRAGIGTVRSVKVLGNSAGSPHSNNICCRSNTTMLSSPSPINPYVLSCQS